MELVDLLLTEPWWVYDPNRAGFWGQAYRMFNLLEGFVWLVIALVIFNRYFTTHTTRWDVPYGVLFILFGLSDFREAYVESAALVAIKAMILASLIYVRQKVHASAVALPSNRETDGSFNGNTESHLSIRARHSDQSE